MSDPTDRLFGWRPWALALAVVVGLTLVRLISLAITDLSLHFDEAQYWFWAQEPAFGYYSKPPLIGWLIAGTTALCGDGAFCIRWPAPVIHGLTALALGWAAGLLLPHSDPRTAPLVAIIYVTLPAVGFSAFLLTTDVPLLLCWALGMAALGQLLREEQVRPLVWIVVLAAAIGFGLLAKYALIYFLLGLGLWLVWLDPTTRARLWRPVGLAILFGLILFSPNLIWNAAEGWPTIGHTADNANWQGNLLNFNELAEFVGTQFGVFGPVLLPLFAVAAFHLLRERPDRSEKLLLALCLPILVIVTCQAFISRAHANWAAPAWLSALVLTVHVFANRQLWRRWALGGSALAHGLAGLVFAFFVSGLWRPPGIEDLPAFDRHLGWDQVARDVTRLGGPETGVIAGERKVIAQLVYHLHRAGYPGPVGHPPVEGPPKSHYEMVLQARLEDAPRWIHIRSQEDAATTLVLEETVGEIRSSGSLGSGMAGGRVVGYAVHVADDEEG